MSGKDVARFMENYLLAIQEFQTEIQVLENRIKSCELSESTLITYTAKIETLKHVLSELNEN